MLVPTLGPKHVWKEFQDPLARLDQAHYEELVELTCVRHRSHDIAEVRESSSVGYTLNKGSRIDASFPSDT